MSSLEPIYLLQFSMINCRAHDSLLFIFVMFEIFFFFFLVISLQNIHFEVSVFSDTLLGPEKQTPPSPHWLTGWRPICS